MVPDDESVRLLSHELEDLDYPLLYQAYSAKGRNPAVAPKTMSKRKKRCSKQDISKRENMGYDAETDSYICHNGKHLDVSCIRRQKSKNGYESDVTVYECEDCTGCPYKEKCTKSNKSKKLYVSKKFIGQRQTLYENIMSELGIKYRTNRSIQAEGAFYSK